MQYLYKYVYKGPDMAAVAMEYNQEGTECEITNLWFPDFSQHQKDVVQGRDPSIQWLAVHENNTQTVTFQEQNPEDAIANPKDTTLLAWLKLNQSHPEARGFKYHEIL